MSARSRKRFCLQNGSPPGGRRWLWMVVGAWGVLGAQAASADPQVVLPQGLPVQVKPTYTEPGLPQFTFPTSGGSLLGGWADAGSGSGGDGSTNTSSGGGSAAGSGDAYNSMMSQSWGSSAANAAGAPGGGAAAVGGGRRQRRRLQLDDVSELGFVCGQCGGRPGRERDGAGGDLCDGVELSEREFVRR